MSVKGRLLLQTFFVLARIPFEGSGIIKTKRVGKGYESAVD